MKKEMRNEETTDFRGSGEDVSSRTHSVPDGTDHHVVPAVTRKRFQWNKRKKKAPNHC